MAVVVGTGTTTQQQQQQQQQQQPKHKSTVVLESLKGAMATVGDRMPSQ